MSDKRDVSVRGSGTPARSTSHAIDTFLATAKATVPVGRAKGRIVFGLDATASRERTWNRARDLQAGMFAEAGRHGTLAMQLAYFRGLGECRSSRWVTDASALSRTMGAIRCEAGLTQIAKVLSHVAKEAGNGGVTAAILIGDACEENIDVVADRAGKLKLLGAPVFAFLEGRDPDGERAFRTIAKLSGGAFARFDGASAAKLRDLLNAVAKFAAGGATALDRARDADRLLLEQLGR